LTELCGELEQEDEIADNQKKRKRLSKKIEVIENRFETMSTFAVKTLKELSEEDGPENPELVAMSKVIICMCQEEDGLDELCYQKPLELARLILGDLSQKEGLDLFSSFVSSDLEQAFKTENGRKRLRAWAEGECRDHVETLGEGLSVSTTDDFLLPKNKVKPVVGEKRKTGLLGFAKNVLTGKFWGETPKDLQLEEVLEVAGLKTWAQEIQKVVRGDKEVDAVIPRKWQRYLKLVCCKIFLETLGRSCHALPWTTRKSKSEHVSRKIGRGRSRQ